MIIYRIPIRIILRNKGQFMGIFIMMLLATMTYSLLSISMFNIENNYKLFTTKYVQEDAHFITLEPINEKKFEEKYGLKLEERKVSEIEMEGKTLRIFSPPKEINKCYAIAGKDYPDKREILLDTLFAQANNIKIGDEYIVGSRNFRVAGFISLPDYIYIIRYDQDLMNNSQKFGIGILNDSDLAHFEQLSYHYYVVKNLYTNIDEIKEDLKKYSLINFVEKNKNPRIVYTEMKVNSTKSIIAPITLFITFISSFLLFIVLLRIINSMQVEIGTLYAIGYKKMEIFKTFMIIPVILWVTGSLVGLSLGYTISLPFIDLYKTYFNIPIIYNVVPIREIIFSILLPGVFVIFSSILGILKLLKKEPVELIRGDDNEKVFKFIDFPLLDRFNFINKIMIKYGLIRISRELVMITGIAFAAFLLIYGFTAEREIRGIVENTFNRAFNYNYMYIFNETLRGEKYREAERFNVIYLTDEKNSNVIIYGIESNSKMIKLTNLKGENADISGLVITKPLAIKLGVKIGDKVALKNNVDDKIFMLTISDIVDINLGNYGYMRLVDFNQTFDYPEGSYRGIFSKVAYDIKKSILFLEQDKSYIIESFKNTIEPMRKMLSLIGGISSILSLAITYVFSNLIINENRKNIAIFKVLGYYDREISKIILGSNRFSFFVGILLGIPLFNILSNLLISNAAKQADFYIEFKADFFGILLSYLILIIIYMFSQKLSINKIYSISMSQILKEKID